MTNLKEKRIGVDYTAVLMIGREFDSSEEAIEFLRSKGIEIPDSDAPEMEDGLGEYLYSADVHGLRYEMLNYYVSEDYGVLGWKPSVREVDKFADSVQEMRKKWERLFGEVPELVHSVKVH